MLPARYVRRLRRFRYGPAVFKLDWALGGAIPWRDPRCLDASTVHVGGTIEEIAAAEAAVWRGEHPERPFVLVCQQSQFDPSRAPAGRHTGYAYCHVPAGSTVDVTAQIEAQIERFAPGFRERILARAGVLLVQKLRAGQARARQGVVKRLGLRLSGWGRDQGSLGFGGGSGAGEKVHLLANGAAEILEGLLDIGRIVVGLVGVLRAIQSKVETPSTSASCVVA